MSMPPRGPQRITLRRNARVKRPMLRNLVVTTLSTRITLRRNAQVKPVFLSPLDHATEFSAFASAAVLAALRRVQALDFSVGERR